MQFDDTGLSDPPKQHTDRSRTLLRGVDAAGLCHTTVLRDGVPHILEDVLVVAGNDIVAVAVGVLGDARE